MKIGIDARFFGPNSGIGRYVSQLIKYLEQIDSRHEYWIFLKKENYDLYHPSQPNFQKALLNYHWYTLAEQIFIPKKLQAYNLDLMHFPHFNVPLRYKGAFVVTIHDLIMLHYPSIKASTLPAWLFKLKFAFYKKTIKQALAKAEQVIAVSKFTKQDIVQTFAVPEQKITITYEGLTKLHEQEDSLKSDKKQAAKTDLSLLNKYKINDPFLLYVGNAYPHKNLEQLSRLWQQWPQNKQYQLVLAGKTDFFYQRLAKQLKQDNIDNIILTGFVPDHELPALMRQAQAYIFPSLYEGFGLPALEAMQYGTPVLSSNKSCLPEILDSAALYFDPQSDSDFFDKLEKIINDAKLRQQLITQGYKQIKKYSWLDCAKQTAQVYKQALKGLKQSD